VVEQGELDAILVAQGKPAETPAPVDEQSLDK